MGGRTHTMQVGDSMLIGHTLLTVDSLRAIRDSEKTSRGLLDKDLAIAACVQLRNKEMLSLHEPLYIVRDSLIIPDMFEAEGYGIKMRVESFNPEDETLEMTIWEHISVRRDFVVMQAVLFPMINVLWLGCILMAIGSGMAVYARWTRDEKSKSTKRI
jgi:cytochrome c-type biogenesis protein CcmF